MKKIALSVLSVCMLLSLSACFFFGKAYEADEKVFTAEGISLTLTEAFDEAEEDGFYLCYGARDAAFFGEKILFSDEEGLEDYSLNEYAELLYEYIEDEQTAPLAYDGSIPVIEYTATGDDGTEYAYYTAVYKGVDAFWYLQWTCETEVYEEYKPYFVNWARLVDVSGAN